MISDSKWGTVDEYVLEYGEYLIGQDPQCDIRLIDPASSARHAQLHFGESGLRVVDLGGVDGTFIGDQRIENSREIGAGTLRIGCSKIILVVDEQPHSDSAEPARLRVAVLHPRISSDQEYDSKEIVGLSSQDVPVDRIGDALESGLDDAEVSYQYPPKTEATPETAITITHAESGLREDLSVGAFVEFYSRRSTKRVLRVKSISGLGGVYFFHDQKSSDTALCLTAERLSECLQDRSLRVVGRPSA